MKNNYIKNTWDMIFYNFGTFIGFEFLYKILFSMIALPIFVSSFHVIMEASGYSYLTRENMAEFIFNPVFFCLLILILLFFGIFIIFDLSTMIIIFDESYHKNKINIKDAIKISFLKCKNAFKIQNILVCLLVLFLIPFLSIGIESFFLTSIQIPEVVTNYISSNMDIILFDFLIYFILLILLFPNVFAFHYIIIEDKNYKNAKKFSQELIRKHKIFDYLELFFGRFLFVFLFMIVLLISYFLVIGVYKLFVYFQISQHLFVSFVWGLLVVVIFCFIILSNGVSYAIISSFFYRHKQAKKEKIIPIKNKVALKNKKNNRYYPFFILLLLLSGLIGGATFTYQIKTGQTNFNIEFLREMEITAHRGASVHYPENTMPAFRGAKAMGADWIELDVQETKDGEIVVCHDTNLIRVARVNKNIYDLTYDEIQKLDVGSFYSEEYKNEKMPLLSEVIEFAKENGIRLNIELKPTGHEEDLEKKVVDMVHEYHIQDLCVLTSQNYHSLEKVKAVCDDITTVYVMAIAIGDITEFEYADAYSVEASNITDELVHLVHAKGKEIYAWTLNTEEDINLMIDRNVDNIITDNIEMCREIVIKRRSSNLVQDFINSIQE